MWRGGQPRGMRTREHLRICAQLPFNATQPELYGVDKTWTSTIRDRCENVVLVITADTEKACGLLSEFVLRACNNYKMRQLTRE
jgi:hypothetical protein